MKNIFFCIIICLTICKAFGQGPEIEWQKSYGGSDSDGPRKILETYDGGYLVAGTTLSADVDVHGNVMEGWDIWILRLNSIGDTLWTKLIDAYGTSFINSIEKTTDGNYLICGKKEIPWIAKLNDQGNLIWETDAAYQCGGAVSILETSSGDLICVGARSFIISSYPLLSQSELMLAKLNSVGDTLFSKIYGGSEHDESAIKIIKTYDGNYLVLGYAYSNNGDVHGHIGNKDFWVIKVNESLDTLWTRCYGGTYDDNPSTVIETTDGGFLFVGYTYSSDGDVVGFHGTPEYSKDGWLLKTDADGNIQWSQCYGNNNSETISSAVQTSEGEFITIGTNGSEDVWILKLDILGNIVWEEVYGGTRWEYGEDIKQNQDGDYVFCASTMSDDGDVTNHIGSTQNTDYWIVKLISDESSIEESDYEKVTCVFPNPASQVIYIKRNNIADLHMLQLFNLQGVKLEQAEINESIYELHLNQYKSGSYIIKLYNKNGEPLRTWKIIKQ